MSYLRNHEIPAETHARNVKIRILFIKALAPRHWRKQSKNFSLVTVQRFDSDNIKGEHLNEVFEQVKNGEVQILVGTQLLAKGLDLPRLGLVGIINAESSLGLPDYGSESDVPATLPSYWPSGSWAWQR